MRWITLSEALDLIGHDQKDALRRALRAGDVKSRIRYDNGAVKSLNPWHWDCEIDWDGARLAVDEFQFFVIGGGRAPSLPLPPKFVPVEVDRVTLLENFESRARTQSSRELHPRKSEPAGFKEWFVEEHIPAGYSTREQSLAAARARFGCWTKDRETVRGFRKIYAPDNWKDPGPKKIRRK